jgi:hypothetical protein
MLESEPSKWRLNDDLVEVISATSFLIDGLIEMRTFLRFMILMYSINLGTREGGE